MESWKIIEGFENYMVSDHGNVKNNKTGCILKQHVQDGYKRLTIHLNKTQYKKYVHVLVASEFIPNPENKQCVDHIDNCKTNNNISNLRWATHTENMQNSSVSKNNASGSKGVHYDKASQKWISRIVIDGIRISLGSFANLEDAKQVRIIKANQAFGIYTNACENII